MKHLLICGAILLGAPALSQAQLAPEQAPTLLLPKASSQTPALDAFAGVATQLQLQVRWVRIDAANLPANLPAWNKAGASAGASAGANDKVNTWSHVATPAELKTLEVMNRIGLASTTNQQIGATNNQTAALSFAPFTTFSIQMPKPGPLDEMIIPRTKPDSAAPPIYIPNLAKPESRLPDMAPMPGAGGKNDPPFIDQFGMPNLRDLPRTLPQMSPELAELMAYKFQIRPTVIGDQVALDLRSLNSADNIMSLARANHGETVVFALPNIVELPQKPGRRIPDKAHVFVGHAAFGNATQKQLEMTPNETAPAYPALEVIPKTGAETLRDGGIPLSHELLDFWRWSASDLMSNATRGVLAEWIVARALDLERSARVEWDAFDLLTPEGIRIEVKSSAYLQSWAQSKLSPIRFDIRPTRLEYEDGEAKRRAQIYVFCLLAHREQATIDPLDLKQWEFYVLPTATLNRELPAQRTLGLAGLLKLAPRKVGFAEIAACVQAIMAHSETI